MRRTISMLTVVAALAGYPAGVRAQEAPSSQIRNGVASFEIPVGEARLAASGATEARPWLAAPREAAVVPVPAFRSARRPGALVPLYVAFAATQAADAFTTRASLRAGAIEQNQVAGVFGKNTGAMLGFKAVTTAGTIFAAEKMWKKSRVGAVVLMAVLNGVTAAVAAHNVRVARAVRVR